MTCGTVNFENLSEKFNHLNNERKRKDYDINFCKIKESNNKFSKTKTTLGVASLCILGFLSWKYVIKPVASTLKSILNIDEIKEEEHKQKLSKIFRSESNERIFDGEISKFDKSDAITVEHTVIS